MNEPAVLAPTKLLQKIVAIRKAVERIEKTGFNQSANYNYAPDQLIKETFKPLMDQHGVVLQFSLTNKEIVTIDAKGDRKAVYLIFVEADYTFWDSDSGESLSGHWIGDGQLRDDKGLYAATTGLEKYAIMAMMFMPTGDDPEDKRFDKGGTKGREAVSTGPTLKPSNEKVAAELEQKLESEGKITMQKIAEMRQRYGGSPDIAKMRAPALKNYITELGRFNR